MKFGGVRTNERTKAVQCLAHFAFEIRFVWEIVDAVSFHALLTVAIIQSEFGSAAMVDVSSVVDLNIYSS